MTQAGPVRPDSSRRIVLGIGGGIAAYKVCEVLRRLTEAGHLVRVVPTQAALKFVGAPTWEALSGLPVHHDVFVDVPEVPHVRLGQAADLVVVAPAPADLLALSFSTSSRSVNSEQRQAQAAQATPCLDEVEARSE